MLNPIQMLGMMNNVNPVQMMQNAMSQQLQSNPLFQRAQEMAKGKNPEELKQICGNLCEQRGINLEQAFNQFQNQFNRRA